MNTQREAGQQTSAQCLLVCFPITQLHTIHLGVVLREAAVMFAKTNSIPLVIKNSGHDVAGRSSAPSGLAIWMNAELSGYITRPQFVLTDCSDGAVDAAVTFGVRAFLTGDEQASSLGRRQFRCSL
ncbi:hypothetical protein L210DRAFT_2504837 [Boletus edulis BED1]|uniref:FAD linked oxidase N-terminal domain-containing protein n=1 Tax=Boletus edulis BED1 TaxID=1328754 RepID=A0AAD4BN93_BOLED|nr:hypothetical protein L210DRAFT_2504837 [Boletus edulis BED1]